ncbi:hypothetical protein [Ruminococcus turbiniformis]|uniref:hypothetical protein n=1 Tax=Ruminococcus turbiniformis TaxID=2881258 RepID=UPI001D1109E0|nr:hypothetical protein [Ruminococcus turbiniformis]
MFLCAVTNCPDEKYRFPHLKNEIYAIRHPRKEKSGKKSTPHPLLGTIRSYAYIKPQNSCFDLYNMHKWRLTAIGFLKNGGSPPPVLIRLAGFTHRQSGLFSPKMRTWESTSSRRPPRFPKEGIAFGEEAPGKIIAECRADGTDVSLSITAEEKAFGTELTISLRRPCDGMPKQNDTAFRNLAV